MTPSADSAKALAGTSVLVVDDEFLIALELEAVVREGGAVRVAVCTSVEEALAAIAADGFDVAILDVRLGTDTSKPVAARLTETGTPFVFYSGETLPSELRRSYPEVLKLVKPAPQRAVIRALSGLLGDAGDA